MRHSKEDHDWSNPAELARFADMWIDGEPTSVIAAEFGVSVNAVVGIRARLQLPARPSPLGHNPSALTIDFPRVHSLRLSGKTWPAIGLVVEHRAKPLSQWYYAQCAKRGVDPAMLCAQPAKRAPIARPKPARLGAKAAKAPKPVPDKAPQARKPWHPFFKNAPVSASDLPAPISGGVLYEYLHRGCCNWMLNDARPWRACGAPAGRVYCGEHARQASARFCTRVVLVGEVAA